MIRFAEVLERGGQRTALGTWVKLPIVESIELMALAGFDFIVLDLEHSPMTTETASTLIAIANGRGLCPLVRVPDHSPAWIQRVLDAGAAGVLAPHVDSVQQALAVTRSARFEPDGTRGVGPTSRAGDWGLTPIKDYLAEGAHAAVIGQIESDHGVRATVEILAEKRLDALFVGPADLSVSLGRSTEHPDVTTRIRSVVDACREAEVPVGTAIGADPARAAQLGQEGFAFVMVSNDATILGSGGARLVRDFRSALGS